MRKRLRQLQWRHFPIRVKVGVIFGAQLALIILLGMVAFLALRGVGTQTRRTLDTSLALYSRARNLGIYYSELRELEQEIAEGYYDADFQARAEAIATRHSELIQESVINETDAILALGAAMESGRRAEAEGQVNVIRRAAQQADEDIAQALARVDALADPDFGALAQLHQDGEELQALTALQNDRTLTAAFVLLQQRETEYLLTREGATLNALQEAGDSYRRALRAISPEGQVAGLDAALEAYLVSVEDVSVLFEDLAVQLERADGYLTQMDGAIDRLGDLAGRRFVGGLAIIERTQSTATLALLASVLIAALSGGAITFLFGQGIVLTLLDLTTMARRAEAGDLAARVSVRRDDEFGQLANSFNAVVEQFEELMAGLERRVLGRTRDLTITAEISHAVATLREPKALMDDIVEMIRESFGFYHAQVFLVDPSGKDAALFASTGEAGQKLLARRHSLPVGSRSVIGQVTEHGEPVIASDASTDPVHRRNELLPDTRSEMALPMRAGERIIGALDVQSVEPNAFSPEDAAVLQIVADQLAIAVENARLFLQTQAALAEIEALNRRLLGQAWVAHTQQLRERQVPLAYRLDEADVAPHGDGAPLLLEQAIRTGRLVTSIDPGEDGLNLAVPIKVRGEVVGAFGFGGEALVDPTEDELALIQAVADRVGLALENIRLFEETQRLAERERLVSDITAKIVGSTDVGTILQTTVRELGRVLRAPQISVQLHREDVPRDEDES